MRTRKGQNLVKVPVSPMDTPAQVFRFGPYESRPRSRELYKHGLRLKVRPQPLQVLNLLLNRAGDVVSREVLREELWSAETFVDFEHSLNTAVKEIRATLGDSPLTPRYIETLPRLGYRFIAPVEVINGFSDLVPSPAPSTSNPNGNPASVAAAIPTDIPASEISGEGVRQDENRHPYLWLAVALAAAGVALAISASLWLRKTEYFWRNPIADARFQTVTDFEGVEQAAAVSRDGHLVAFLSDRDGPMDVWVTQVGSGEFHNLTRGQAPEIANPLLRNLRFSPDGSLITFWGRQRNGFEQWEHQRLGGANSWRTAEAIPGRRRRTRLVPRRLADHIPHAWTWRSDVRVRRQRPIGPPSHLHCACRSPRSLSAVVA
jgi:DNA-binding winged helix-turn-helix (wHTH) protein